MEQALIALYLAAALAVHFLLHEYVRDAAIVRLGDPTPRLWGHLRPNPKPLIDPVGTVILPTLILLLWASNSAFRPPPFAYGKQPVPVDPNRLKRADRDVVLISLAGPAANLAAAVVAGLVLRVAAMPLGATRAVFAFLYVGLTMFVFNLMPIPGLDGARILARFLPIRARMVYTNLDQYLVLFMLVVFFIFSGPLLAIVDGLSGGLCRLVTGFVSCTFL